MDGGGRATQDAKAEGSDLAISVQKRLNKWTGFTGLCNSVNPVNPVIFLVPATGCTRCRVSNFRLKMYFFY
jgi:hypothetical protein